MATLAEKRKIKTLAKWRVERDLTVEALGEVVGLNQGLMGNHIQGRRELRIRLAYQIAHTLGVEVTQIGDWNSHAAEASGKNPSIGHRSR